MIGRSTLGIAWLALVATACYPDRSVDSTSEFASVTTAIDNTADFSTITKYAMPDTVLYVPKEDKEVPAATQAAILSQVRQNLNALGWQEVTNPSATNPVDAYVTNIITTQLNVYYYYYWWDYWYWYGGWPPGWGGGYGWYYPPTWYTYAYTTGTLMMSIINAKTSAVPGRDKIVPVVWSGAANGILADQATNVAIVTAAIDQAFKQSPYLGGASK